MLEILLDTIIDSLKILPFLFIAFLIIEFFEHKITEKSKNTIKKSKKIGPLIGSIAGIFPQCGFSVIATNLYITRIITLGTLISVYLTTSDEMLPILIAHQASISTIISILFIKFIIGVIFGFIIDLVIKKPEKESYHICKHDNCHCEKSIIKSSLIHTLKILTFIFIITFILNAAFFYTSEKYIQNLFKQTGFLAPFITSLIGLIPNCGPSVILTELYLNNILSLGPAIAGLLSSSGIGLLILFKTNKDFKENIKIITIIYFISVISGIIIESISLV